MKIQNISVKTKMHQIKTLKPEIFVIVEEKMKMLKRKMRFI